MHRLLSSLALVGIVLGSIALPCFAAGRAMAAERAAPMAPCGAPGETTPTMMCPIPGDTARLGVAPVELSAPVAFEATPVVDRRIVIPVAPAGRPLAHDGSPPASAPAFLLHSALLI